MNKKLACTCTQLSVEFDDTKTFEKNPPNQRPDSEDSFTYLHNDHVIATEGNAICRTDTRQGQNRYQCAVCKTEVFCVSLEDREIIGINNNLILDSAPNAGYAAIAESFRSVFPAFKGEKSDLLTD